MFLSHARTSTKIVLLSARDAWRMETAPPGPSDTNDRVIRHTRRYDTETASYRPFIAADDTTESDLGVRIIVSPTSKRGGPPASNPPSNTEYSEYRDR